MRDKSRKILNIIGLKTLILVIIILAAQLSFISILGNQKSNITENTKFTYLFDKNNPSNQFVGIEWDPSFEILVIGSENGSLHLYDNSLNPIKTINPNLDMLQLTDFSFISNDELVLIYPNSDLQLIATIYDVIEEEAIRTETLLDEVTGRLNWFLESEIIAISISYSLLNFYSAKDLELYSTFNISSHLFTNPPPIIQYEIKEIQIVNNSIARVLYTNTNSWHSYIISLDVISGLYLSDIEFDQAIYSMIWAGSDYLITNNVTHLNVLDSELEILNSIPPRENGTYDEAVFNQVGGFEISSNTLITTSMTRLGYAWTRYFDLWKMVNQDPYLIDIIHIESEGSFNKILSTKEGIIISLEDFIVPNFGDRLLIIQLPVSMNNMYLISSNFIDLLKLIFFISIIFIILIVSIMRYRSYKKIQSTDLYPNIENSSNQED